MLFLLDKGRLPASVAEDPGLNQATVYHYAAAFATLGLERYLQHKQPGYWGVLTSAQLAHLRREVNQTLYLDYQAIQAWLEVPRVPTDPELSYSRFVTFFMRSIAI